DDIRLQRRRRLSARGGITDTCVREPGPGEHQGISTSSLASALSFPSEDTNVAPSQGLDDPFADDPFGLSLDSILFLDQVFMGDAGPAEWNSSLQIGSQQDPSSSQDDNQSEQTNTIPAELLDQYSWPDDLGNPATLTAALCSYFNFAASFLSILLEDAFWRDYHANRCSPALVYAIACRGLPFTAATNQWDLQQRLACRFREAFLQARSNASDDGMVRLDDLEALALMLGFEYEDAGSAPLHSS